MQLELITDLNGLEVTVLGDIIKDSNYGADIDGNRGIEAIYIEELIIESSGFDITEYLNTATLDRLESELIEYYRLNY